MFAETFFSLFLMLASRNAVSFPLLFFIPRLSCAVSLVSDLCDRALCGPESFVSPLWIWQKRLTWKGQVWDLFEGHCQWQCWLRSRQALILDKGFCLRLTFCSNLWFPQESIKDCVNTGIFRAQIWMPKCPGQLQGRSVMTGWEGEQQEGESSQTWFQFPSEALA